jgi:hypothetical protein
VKQIRLNQNIGFASHIGIVKSMSREYQKTMIPGN